MYWMSVFLMAILIALGLSPKSASADARSPSTPVTLAGLAYAGSESTIATRFPHSKLYADTKVAAGSPVHQMLLASLNSQSPSALQIVQNIEELNGRDQALSVALVVGSETVVIEQLGSMHKLLVLIRGQAMFFDFKTMNVLRSYPLSFAYVDLFDRRPSDQEVAARVQLVYEGTGEKPGLIDRFGRTVAQASIPAVVSKSIRVTSAKVAPEAMEFLPEFIKMQPGVSETWLADIVGEAISTRMGIPIVPYAKGYAVGNVMSMTVSDGKVWELNLPPADYQVGVELTGLKKIKFDEVSGGATSFVYGAYASLRITDALGGGLNTALKNGETRVIPASQHFVDDFPHYYDAINGLFNKTALAIAGQKSAHAGNSNPPSGAADWIKMAASAKDIGQQVDKVRVMLMLAK